MFELKNILLRRGEFSLRIDQLQLQPGRLYALPVKLELNLAQQRGEGGKINHRGAEDVARFLSGP